MDLYHIWCDLKPGVGDLDFCRSVERYLTHLREQGRIAGHRLTRRKLGLGSPELGEFHITIEVRDLEQLDSAFRSVASRTDPVESFHHAVNSLVRNARFALYRDFPDPVRVEGQEKF